MKMHGLLISTNVHVSLSRAFILLGLNGWWLAPDDG
jgi:hypothetical protein